MVALEADGSASRPPHPTLPPYTPHKTLSYQRLLNFHTRRPLLPPQWPMPAPGSRSYVEPRRSSSTPSAMTLLTTTTDTPSSTLQSPSPALSSPSLPFRHPDSAHPTPDTTAHQAERRHPLPTNVNRPPQHRNGPHLRPLTCNLWTNTRYHATHHHTARSPAQ